MALQDDKKNTRRQAARLWAVALFALFAMFAGCASGPEESYNARRMRLYREYYHNLTPQQRREYLANTSASSGVSEEKLREYAAANKAQSAMLGKRDLKSTEIEKSWKQVEEFLARAEDYASRMKDLRGSNASAAALEEAQLLSRCRELSEELKRGEKQIRRTPYSATERARLLERNNYHISRLNAIKVRISKSE